MSSSYRCTIVLATIRTASDLGLVKGFCVCFTYLGPVCLFCVFDVFGVFSPVCFVLSVPVQVIAWKDSSPK